MLGIHMRDEICDQVALARRWAERGGFDVARAAGLVTAADGVVLIARGTSDNAADYARYLLDILGGFHVASASPSTTTIYGAGVRSRSLTGIAVSQSGGSPDLVAAARGLRERGGRVIAVTNTPGSPLAAESDVVIDIDARPEHAVAATKSFTMECLALLDLAVAASDCEPPDRAAIAESIATSVDIEVAGAVDLLSDAFAAAGHLVVVGRGLGTPIAREGALKIMETTRVPALAYSAADFEHGPVSIVGPGTPVLIMTPQGRSRSSLDGLRARLTGLGAVAVTVGGPDDTGLTHLATAPLRGMTADVGDPIACGVLVQRLARELAVAAGLDPDQPSGLSKVTRTV